MISFCHALTDTTTTAAAAAAEAAEETLVAGATCWRGAAATAERTTLDIKTLAMCNN